MSFVSYVSSAKISAACLEGGSSSESLFEMRANLHVSTNTTDTRDERAACRVSRDAKWHCTSSDLNIASRGRESSTHLRRSRAITERTSRRRTLRRRSRIEIACRDPVNGPRPTFAKRLPTPCTRIRSQTMNFAFVTFAPRETEQRRRIVGLSIVVRDREYTRPSIPYVVGNISRLAEYFERADTREMPNVPCATPWHFYFVS